MGLGLSAFACTACTGMCGVLSFVCSFAGCLCSGDADTPKDLMVGKIRSMGLVIISIVIGLVVQYVGADWISKNISSWEDGCSGNDVCIGNSAILRVSLVDGLFFAAMAIGAFTSSLFNNKFWAFKFLLWLGMLIGSIFVPNKVFDDRGYEWVARVGAFFFIILQQIVLIDIAYNWNDGWVEKANALGDNGKKYLYGLVLSSAIMLSGSIVAIAFIIEYFKGCTNNEVVLSFTVIFCVLITIIQLLGSEGNLLASSIVCAYAVFLAFSSVSKNPSEECNPFVGTGQNVTAILIGLSLTLLSLMWICGSAGTSVTKLLGGETPPATAESVKNAEMRDAKKEGEDKATSFADKDHAVESGKAETKNDAQPDDHGDGWKFNIVMVLISMFFGMMLTNWGVVQSNDESTSATDSSNDSYSDPKNGKAALWITAASQWVCLLLYLWSLTAPRLFPDRDFS